MQSIFSDIPPSSFNLILISISVAIIFILGSSVVQDVNRPRLKRRAEQIREDLLTKNISTRARANSSSGGLGKYRAHLRDKLQEFLKKRLGQNKSLDKVMANAGVRNPYFRIYYFLSKLIFIGIAVISVLIFDGIYNISIFNPQLYYLILFCLPFGASYIPNAIISLWRRKRQNEIMRHWGDALDLLVICIESGLTMEAGLRRVASEMSVISPSIAEEMVITFTELTLLSSRRDAFANLSERTDVQPVRTTVVALIQAEKQGASIGRSLRAIAKANREDLLASADKKAASLGPKLTVPMVVFFLPVLFAILLTPMFLGN